MLLADQLVAGLGVEGQRDLVRHRRGRHEDGFFLAEQQRGALLQLVHRRVLALLLVPDRGDRDRGAHAGGRPGGGVGAEVDHSAHATVARVDLTLLEQTLADRGQPAFRAGQVWEWAARGAAGYAEMTNVPRALRDELAAVVPFSTLSLEDEAGRPTAPSRRSSAPRTAIRSRRC